MTPAPQVATVLQSILQMEGLRILREPQRLRNLLTERTSQQPTREREVLLRAMESPIFEQAWQALADKLNDVDSTKIQTVHYF